MAEINLLSGFGKMWAISAVNTISFVPAHVHVCILYEMNPLPVLPHLLWTLMKCHVCRLVRSTNIHTTTDRLATITPTGANVYFYCLHSGGVEEEEWGREPSWFVYIIVCIRICMLALIISGPCISSILTEYPAHFVCRQPNNKIVLGVI